MSSIVLIIFVVFGAPPLYGCQGSTQLVDSQPSAVWMRLLQESERGEGSRSYVQEVAASGYLSIDRKLASLILREWGDLKSDAPARLVYTPRLPKGVKNALPNSIVAQYVLVKARIDETGFIESYEFVKPSRYEVLNDAVREAIPHVRYRPARNSLGTYVPGESVLSFRLHID